MILYRTAPLIVALAFLFSPVNNAQDEDYSPFKLDLTREAVILGTGVFGGFAAITLISNLDPLTIYEVNALDPNDVNSFDRSAIGPKQEENTGDFLLFMSYALPLSFLAYEDTRKDFPELLLMYGEVLLITGALNGIVKGISKRTRPYAYYDETTIDKRASTEARVSFYSGHTSVTAAITFFTASVFTTYITDNTARILIWSAAALYPAVTGYLRVSSSNHFPTDVIVGYIVGAGIGFLIPELHKVSKESGLSLYPMKTYDGGGFGLTLRF
jgi:membrane-associated phospholipid phosphatase